MTIEHVIFDGFGTVVQRLRPMSFYNHMQCPSPVPVDWTRAMTAAHPWRAWARSIGKDADLAHDLENIVAYGDVASTMALLGRSGIRYSIMSNLASCYGDPLRLALADFPVQHWFLSYHDGMKKPDPRYYGHALDILGLQGKRVLFVGDHPRHDVQGPALCGMNALRVRREIIGLQPMLEAWC